jgi:MerR family transcriptional regulator, thiopeptide resistance regulator
MSTGNGDGRAIGALAKATGLTVRTLHHYEEIGLLVASERTAAGHRRYVDADVARLYRICLLRRLGLPLAEIGRALDDPAWAMQPAMATHLRELDRRLAATNQLRGRIAKLAGAIDTDHTDTDDLLQVVEEMTMLDTTVQKRISILVYADLEAAYDHLIRIFGLEAGELTRDESGKAVHGELHAGDGVVWLHPEAPEFGMQSPQTLGGASASVALMVDDVDAHFAHAKAEGATIDYEPVDQPYGYREYSARDSEGALWSFMKPLD